jgi:subtilisin family serine protease
VLAADPRVLNYLPALLDQNSLVRHFVPDEIDIKFSPELADAEISQILSDHGLFQVASYRTLGFRRAGFARKEKLFQTIRELNNHANVQFAEPAELSIDDEASYTPAASAFARQWGLKNEGQEVGGVAGVAGIDIGASNAWSLTRGGPQTVVAVIDTGADLAHANLVASLYADDPKHWNFTDEPGEPLDSNGHGTHVAGIAAGRDIGKTIGIANQSFLLPLKVDLSSGLMASRADAINFVAEIASQSSLAFIVNCSWKMAGDVESVRVAFRKALDSGVFVVVAAGNQGVDLDVSPRYPACYPDICVVSSIDNCGVKAPNANWGSRVDICAPGVNIYSTYPGNSYFYLSGTSQAAPHVAGVSALVWSVHRDLSARSLLTLLKSSAKAIDDVMHGKKLGAGMVDAYAAVKLASSYE